MKEGMNALGTPEVANNPGTPRVASNPGTPRVANNPGTPEVANNPGTPRVANNPGTPRVTNNPASGNPSPTNQMPNTPEVPAAAGNAPLISDTQGVPSAAGNATPAPPTFPLNYLRFGDVDAATNSDEHFHKVRARANQTMLTNARTYVVGIAGAPCSVITTSTPLLCDTYNKHGCAIY